MNNIKEVRAMKNLSGRIEEIFIEIAFAEERESGQLKNISGRFTEWFDKHFTAITFAEAGDFDTARDVMGGGSSGGKHTVGYCLPGFCTGRA